MSKRILAFLLTLFMIVGMFPLSVSAEEETPGLMFRHMIFESDGFIDDPEGPMNPIANLYCAQNISHCLRLFTVPLNLLFP